MVNAVCTDKERCQVYIVKFSESKLQKTEDYMMPFEHKNVCLEVQSPNYPEGWQTTIHFKDFRNKCILGKTEPPSSVVTLAPHKEVNEQGSMQVRASEMAEGVL